MSIPNYTVNFSSSIEEEWTILSPIYLGDVPPGLGTPDAYCLVNRDEEKILRIDLYGAHSPFQEASFFQGWVVIGFGYSIHFVMLDTNVKHSYVLDSYFGHLYPADTNILGASGTSLYCFDEKARLVWHADHLGVDGVIVSAIRDNLVLGASDWDPPSENWEPFKLSLSTGKKLER